MLKIKDYLLLNKVCVYLENLRDEKIQENDGYSNDPIMKLGELIGGLRLIMDKLENED